MHVMCSCPFTKAFYLQGIANRRGPEGIKWELVFGQIFTEKRGFGSLRVGITNKQKWDWDWNSGKI